MSLDYPPHFVTLGEQDALAAGGDVALAVVPRSASDSSSREVSVNGNKWIRQGHRGLSIAFTVTVIANFVAMTQGQPPALVTYSPLLPLALLLFSGLYLFVLPYATKWRTGRATAVPARDWQGGPG